MRVVRWCVCDLLVPCMHHDGAFCPGSRLERQPTPRFKPLPIMCWHHRPRYHQRSIDCKEEIKKTSYSMNINLITTRLSIAAKRRVLNRFFYSMSQIGRNTPSCASLRHASDLSSIFSKILSTFNQDNHSFVAECYTYFPQPLVRERKKKRSWVWSWGRSQKESRANMAIFVRDSF